MRRRKIGLPLNDGDVAAPRPIRMQADPTDPTAAQALHARLLTLDSHIDIPWPDGPDPFTPTQRRVDIGKMIRGGLRAGCFAAYVAQGPRTPEGWTDGAGTRALGMLDAIRGHGRRAKRTARRAGDGRGDHPPPSLPSPASPSSSPPSKTAIRLGEDVSGLEQFSALGARYLTLTHNGHNALADSSNPRADLGDGPTAARRPQRPRGARPWPP